MKRKNITKTINYGFDLAEYLTAHPKVAEKYKPENFVIFVENDASLNKQNEKLLKELAGKGKKAVKATRKTHKNSWQFEVMSA